MPSSDTANTTGNITSALGQVSDPVFDRTLAELGMLNEVNVDGTRVVVRLADPAENLPDRDELERRIHLALHSPDLRTQLEQHDIVIEHEQMDDAAICAVLDVLGHEASVDGVRKSVFATGKSHARVIVVASGKGGVGKSSVAANLAVALAALGNKVGLLDADVWGFSIPSIMGVDSPPVLVGVSDIGMIVPPVSHGVRVVSMGFFVSDDRPVIWRGPMLHKAIEQFLVDVHWGDIDFLVVDMPPGTGDVAISMAQFLPTAEVVVVTTPQPAAGRVAQRAGKMAEQVDNHLVGVVENMSWLELPDGERRMVFGEGGGEALATQLGVPLLGQVPLDEKLREDGDTGQPVVAAHPDSPASLAIVQIAERISDQPGDQP